MLTAIDLAALTASQGMSLYGASIGELSGFSVSDAGDVNGDGFDDLIIGSREQSRSGFFVAGASYLVYGAATMPASINLSSLGSAGVTFLGMKGIGRVGYAVSAAGDVNADGLDDLIMSAPYTAGLGNLTSVSGETYVVFGSASLPSIVNATSANVTIYGIDVQDRSGISASGAGDVNGDGYDDLVIGAPLADGIGNGLQDAGESYIVFGGASMPTSIELDTLGTAGVTIYGSGISYQSGISVSGTGDVNDDGFDDVIIGSTYAAPLGAAKGEAYVIFGGSALPATIELAVPASTFITIKGADNGDWAGHSVSGGGDVNGDGFDDMLINAPGGDGPGANTKTNAGESYVVFGSTSLPAVINLSTLGTAGVTIFGADALDAGLDGNTGGSISTAGDVNGDGYDDLIIGKERAGAAGNAKSLAGDSIVVFGGPGLSSSIDLATPGSAGITIFGSGAGDNNGTSVSFAGDVNGDGFADLLTGAFLADGISDLASASGESYLIYGGNGFTSSVTHLGTSAAETLTGTAGANVMVGGRGNDILLGNGGADVLNGGEGNDTIAVSTLPFNRASGGNGDDTLRLDGSGLTLNLTSLANNRIQSIEQIDITGTGINTLTLGYRDVLNISDESNQLIVRRNGGDIVNIGGGWTQGADQVISSIRYQVYTQGIATLLVEGRTIFGTAENDAYELTYSDTTTAGTVAVTVSTNGGPVTNVGTFSMNQPLLIQGQAGMDSVRVIGTGSADTFTVINNSLIVNGAGLQLASVEDRTVVGAAGSDAYKFDADTALGTWTLDEVGGGTDTIDLGLTTTQAVTLNLGLATTQAVNANLSLILGSVTHFENAIGGSGADNLTGNSLANRLTGNAGNDILNGATGNDTLVGGANDDTYLFGVASAAEADIIIESSNQGTDTLSFATLTTPVTLNLGSTSVQTVHTNRTLQLNSGGSFENAAGGSGADILTGNLLANRLTGNAGNDTLNGASGNDTLVGGTNSDTYIFSSASTAEADIVIEAANQGTDTLSFASLTTAVTIDLGSTAVQNVHTNRTLKLNSTNSFENSIGGTANDVLLGNALNNQLTGGNGQNILVGNAGADTLVSGTGRDILVGGLGLDTLNGGSNDDILIAGRTTSDANVTNLLAMQAEWISANAYAARITNLRAGVGSPAVSLKATINVLNDAGEDDSLTGGLGTDWYFRALDDAITDLFAGETIDVL